MGRPTLLSSYQCQSFHMILSSFWVMILSWNWDQSTEILSFPWSSSPRLPFCGPRIVQAETAMACAALSCISLFSCLWDAFGFGLGISCGFQLVWQHLQNENHLQPSLTLNQIGGFKSHLECLWALCNWLSPILWLWTCYPILLNRCVLIYKTVIEKKTLT
jgi:hypothetical protein